MKTILTLLLCLIAQAPISAKDWTIESLLTRAVVQADGTIRFSEARTYRFYGSYSRAEYEINKQGFDRLYDIEVWMDGVQMTESDSKDPGSFRVRDRSSRVVIEWFYAAEDTSTVFEVRYKLAGAIVKGPEHSELFWSFIGKKWDRSTLGSDIRVEFERTDGSTSIPVWVEGGVDQLYLAAGDDGRVDVGTGMVPRRDGLRIRMVFPSAWVPDMPVTDGTFTLEGVYFDEQRKFEEIAADDLRNESITTFLRGLLPMLIVGPIFIFGYAFHRFGRRFTPPVLIPETGHTPPSDLPPAIVSWFAMSRQIYPQALVATLLDLARRGHLELTSKEEPQRFGKPKTITSVALKSRPVPTDGVEDFEIELLRHIETCAPEGPVRLDELFPKHKSATTKWYMAWTKMTKANAEARGFMDKSSMKGVALSAVTCIILLLLSVPAMFLLDAPGILAAVLSFIFLIASFFIYRRSEIGELQYRLWMAYRNGLRSGNASDLADVATGTHLVYAVALGLSGGKLTRMLEQLTPDGSVDMWLNTSGFMHNPALFSSQVSGMVASASAGVSSASGASAGSAGGGGGGGAS
ncbi:MAG: hypothetical protein RL177_521 [Bacteroidota bacterium]